jgi:peptidoglycan/LPS O-acetylase OafA/YrhL
MLICGANEVAVYMLTPASFTALGCGALLALVREMPRAQSIIRLLGVTAFIALVAMDVTVRFGSLDVPLWVRYAVTDTLCTAALTALLSKAAEGFTGPVGALLTLAPLRYLGRISYGLYLYHLPALLLVIIAFNKVGLPIPDPGPIKLLIVGAVTVVAAALSWHLFEEPINRLKRLLPYQARRRVIVWAGSVAGSGVGV